jgi:hypothetical protein
MEAWDPCPELVEFYKSYLFALMPWSGQRLSLMDCLVSAYAYIAYLAAEFKQRDTHFSVQVTEGHVQYNSWVAVKENFIYEFAAFLCFTIIRGPDCCTRAMKDTPLITFDKPDSPLFPFIILPVLQMFKNAFGSMFDFNKCVSCNCAAFVSNQRNRLMHYGTYNYAEMHRFYRTRNPTPDSKFFKGVYFPLFKVLTLVSRKFDPFRRTRNGENSVRHYYATNEQQQSLMSLTPIECPVRFKVAVNVYNDHNVHGLAFWEYRIEPYQAPTRVADAPAFPGYEEEPTSALDPNRAPP